MGEVSFAATGAPLRSDEGVAGPMMLEKPLTRFLCWIQGTYFAITGLWPIIELDTFEWVTGAKTDDWLVKTVGALIAVVGAALLTAAWRRRAGVETAVLGMGSAVVLGAVDVIYAGKGVISKIYLLDALPELLFVVLWAFAMWNDRKESRR